MGFITGLLEAVITLGAIALIVLLIAVLIMIVFSLGPMMDKRIGGQ